MAIPKRWGAAAAVLLVAGSTPRAGASGGGAPLADDPTLIALAVALSCADAPEGAGRGSAAASPPATDPEIELVATVRAKALRFDEVPKVDVVLRGGGKRKAVWRTERVNLPMHPEAGVIYRDVELRISISSDVDELMAMLREARRAARGIRIDGEAPAVPVDPAVEAPEAAPAPIAAPSPIAAPPPDAAPPRVVAPPAPVAAAPVEIVAAPMIAERVLDALPLPPPPPPVAEAAVADSPPAAGAPGSTPPAPPPDPAPAR
ncbi:MAG TPA: hypothetical protein VF912_18010 [Anaeromyxobacter sp.]